MPGNGPSPLPIARMVVHAVIAAVFFFALNRYALSQSLELSLVWGAVAALFAAYVASRQPS